MEAQWANVGSLDPVQTFMAFADLETQIARFYEYLAEMFEDDPDLSQFWLDLSTEECEHADALESVAQVLSTLESIDPPQKPFIEPGIVHQLFRVVQACRAHMKQHEKSLDAALACALRLETSELSDIYLWMFDQVPMVWTDVICSMKDSPQTHVICLCQAIEDRSQDPRLRGRARVLREQWEEFILK